MGEMEAWQLYTAVERSRKTPGALAEVGVYKGGSARLICEARGPGRTLHLFDTFEGIPAVEAIDAGHFETGAFKGTLDEVQRVLKPFPDVVYHPGLFPETGREVEDLRFASSSRIAPKSVAQLCGFQCLAIKTGA